MKLTDIQKESIRKVVNYSFEDERVHLDTHIATMFDVDTTDMDDKVLYMFCVEKGIEHIWLELHILNCLLEGKNP